MIIFITITQFCKVYGYCTGKMSYSMVFYSLFYENIIKISSLISGFMDYKTKKRIYSLCMM